MEYSSFIVLAGVPLIIWILLFFQKETTKNWVFIGAFVSTGLSLALLLRSYFEWNWEFLDLISISIAFLNVVVLLAIGRNGRSSK
ncbi:hypothetical protein [Corynebacterium freiburgense]|uniref:hypothetical protein n=1 Tax=Corynebacterium freiburgense TaxID=556548 RepID=UPI0004257D4C|nr:hypothetical protein [Corynebacterium freiburgense]WJZ01584.1 hypothetical protein CFREI_01380 [Corynebacterium freiburgense]